MIAVCYSSQLLREYICAAYQLAAYTRAVYFRDVPGFNLIYSSLKKINSWIESSSFLSFWVCLGEQCFQVYLYFPCVGVCREEIMYSQVFVPATHPVFQCHTLSGRSALPGTVYLCTYSFHKQETDKSTSTTVRHSLDGKGSCRCHNSTKEWLSVQGYHTSGRHALSFLILSLSFPQSFFVF